MKQQTYKIRGMDCAEEIAILKRALGTLAVGEQQLAFDLINGKLTIDGDPDAQSVQRAVAQTGMRAIPWDEHLRRATEDANVPWWRREIRLVLCAVSGIALLLGFLLHAILRGFGEAFTGHETGTPYPLPVIALYVAAMLTGAWFVLPKAWYSARSARPDMNLLMVVAIAGAVMLGDYFEAASVAFLFALALQLESWSVGRARKAIRALVDIAPRTARFRCPHDGCIEEKPVADIALKTTVLVRAGERIPLDGTITVGETTINEAPITGESVPAEKNVGDTVYAGSINEGGAFEFTVTRAAEDTTLARIIRMVEEAQSRRAPSEQWVERFARIYTPVMMLLALGVAVVPPLFGGDWFTWFYEALVILVIACPCALVISTPVSIVAGLASAARHGVLIKGGAFLEAPARLRVLAFDKTGTITTGRPEVQHVVPFNGHTERELLERAAAMEAHSNHPLARAVQRHAAAHGITPEPVDAYREIRGRGAEGTFRGRAFWIGSHRLVHERHADKPSSVAAGNADFVTAKSTPATGNANVVIARSAVGDEAISSTNGQPLASGSTHNGCSQHDTIAAIEAAGHSVVAIGNNDHLCGIVAIADTVRPQAAEILADLRRAGLRLVMLTGDNRGTAEAVGRAVAASTSDSWGGLDEIYAELLPEEKVDRIRHLARDHGAIAMIGDGINDAPALAAAHLGIAMGAAGSDVAIETADIALMSDDLSRLPWLIHHSRRTLRIIQQNIAFALGLKLLFILLAVAGLATLWMAIAADMGASLLVIANALRLLRA